MTPLTISISPCDSWFFRGAKAHNDPGAGAAESVFPPPARTVAGAVRTLLGNLAGRSWTTGATRRSRTRSAEQALFENLVIRGPYLNLGGERHYAIPRSILATAQGGAVRLVPEARATRSDLGRVRLPVVAGAGSAAGGFARVEGGVIAAGGLRKLLDEVESVGSLPTVPLEQLMCREPRLGIERDNVSKAAAEGMLYQPVHARETGAAFSLDVEISLRETTGPRASGERAEAAEILQRVRAALASPLVARFGAEHRAGVYALAAHSRAVAPPVRVAADRLLVVFTSHADFGGDWKPANFRRGSIAGADSWSGWVNFRDVSGSAVSVEITIVSAAIGKPVRESGWDIAEGRARPAVSLVPAGSVWYCTTATPGTAHLLHGRQLGHGSALGRGEVAVGVW